ncbi:hypothetical protein N0V93_007701 [Gnomoniopsis smithogilvyi]|uniref:Uncharacterized protein n=1 Tax=Gnomoniopsis smithogilvyi TaxID=1191159 RepID=A0A9W8YMT5_9PEZI|nr:hypothetical protein N0V93_007701 [Gnomoniopsis smithogilvyi]
MSNSVPVRLEDLGQQSFIPRPFGGRSQVVLNTTSFSAILSQLNNVDQSLAAQENLEEPGPLSILSTGCYLNATSENAADGSGMRAGDGYRDCPAACADPSTMFNSSYTLWNCLTLGAASAYVADYDLSVNSADLTSVGLRMGFDSLDQFNATQIFYDALQCIKGSCSDYSLGSCSKNVTGLTLDGVQNEVLTLFNGLQSYCSGMESVVNSDLAGPGQRRTPWQRAGEHQKHLQRSRPAAALTSALVEFQEVQTFFVISIQFATLIIFAGSDHAAMLSSTNSFAEAVTNVQIVQLLSINGMLPVLFTQIGLMRLGIRWWYMMTLVLGVFVTGLVVSQQSLMPTYTTLWTYFKEESPIDTCGGNPSPMTYCLDSLDGLNATLSRMNSGLVVGCMVIVALLMDQIWHSLNRNGRMDEGLDNWEISNARVLFIRRRVAPVLLGIMWFGLEFALLIYVGIYLKSVIGILKFVGTSASDWTFGQLVAIMVWAPVIGKYLYFNAFGITEGVGKRLHRRYKVVEVGESEDDDGPGPKPTLSSHEKEEGGIEMGLPRKKPSWHTLSREDTLVATLTPATPNTPYADSPYKTDFGKKNETNPFDQRFNQF